MNGSILSVAHHAQVSPVVVLADDVADAAQGGAGVLVDGDLLVGAHGLTLTCSIRTTASTLRDDLQDGIPAQVFLEGTAHYVSKLPNEPVSQNLKAHGVHQARVRRSITPQDREQH